MGHAPPRPHPYDDLRALPLATHVIRPDWLFFLFAGITACGRHEIVSGSDHANRPSLRLDAVAQAAQAVLEQWPGRRKAAP